jgi:hypothetical protein
MENKANKCPERWPDFLIIGAAKAGTTALFKAIARHPRVFEPSRKEPSFFGYEGANPVFKGEIPFTHLRPTIATQSDYLQIFAECPPSSITFEASTDYLYEPRAPASVAKYLPEIPLIAVLRHPVDRAYSHYRHIRELGNEPIKNFHEAWLASHKRMSEGWRPIYDYKGRGYYGAQLSRWLEWFPKQKLLVLFYEDWLNHPQEALSHVWRHLNIEPVEHLIVTKENVSSRQPRWSWLHRKMFVDNTIRMLAQKFLPLCVRDAITWTIKAINTNSGPAIDPGLRAHLSLDYGEDLNVLEKITGRNLAGWRC